MYINILVRVSNPKSESMQNEFSSGFLSRSTLGKIETTPQIGEALEKVRANAILNHEHKYKKSYVTKIMHTEAGALNRKINCFWRLLEVCARQY